ncbi:ABC transporter ATP-binding protein [Streptomyces zhihengii]
MIVGANACGKSLLRSMTRLLHPGPAASSWTERSAPTPGQGARQKDRAAAAITRHPRGHHRARPRRPRPPPAPADLLRMVGAGQCRGDTGAGGHAYRDLIDRAVDELSGGQRQRVWIAMALAQQTDVLLLDEPTTFLDISHQVEVLDLLTDLNRTRGTTIVMTLHDLNLAARYADRLIALADGRLHATGTTEEVMTEDTVRAVYGMDSRVIEDPVSGKPLVLPIGRHNPRPPPRISRHGRARQTERLGDPHGVDPHRSDQVVGTGNALRSSICSGRPAFPQ